MQVYTPYRASSESITNFHAEDYTSFLEKVTPANRVRIA